MGQFTTPTGRCENQDRMQQTVLGYNTSQFTLGLRLTTIQAGLACSLFQCELELGASCIEPDYNTHQ